MMSSPTPMTLAAPPSTPQVRSALGPDMVESTIDRLTSRHGPEHAGRIRRGVEQVARRWWAEDGDAAAFAAFCEASFLTDPEEIAGTFRRLEHILEQMDGHLHEVRRELTFPIDTDTGPLSPVDQLLAEVDLAAHVDEDLFRSRVAFLALLNFPVHTLEERLTEGAGWDRETWARSRLMDRFAFRVPAAVWQEGTRAFVAAERYVTSYLIRADRLATPEGERLFAEGTRLISHWGLRDELAANYVDPSPAGLLRQRTLSKVMERIIRQEIPRAVIDNPDLTWAPETNEVRPVADGAAPPAEREPDTRYATLLAFFHAARKLDPYSPSEPTFIARRFERERQMPQGEVGALLDSVLTSNEVRDLARLIESRVGRPLEPFDIWYPGFKSRAGYAEAELDEAVRARYPDLASFEARLPRLLEDLGFLPDRAQWLAQRIVVDPARGAGHALQAIRRGDRARLRTRVPRGGMDYKGYTVAMHELGHNVEQVFSLDGVDHWSLAGVPNNACTEAFAFVFQHRDLEMLGLQTAGEELRHIEALAILWNTYEIAGVSLVDMRVWSWMYEHPEATPAELREAVRAIARDVWNRYFAPVFGVRDAEILAIYSHMIVYGLYLPDYAIGHLIAFQIAERLRQGDFGAEVERIARQGRLTPDAWVRGAVGEPISAAALLAAAREALDAAPFSEERYNQNSLTSS
ncbi:MAG TPA: hypothetical protein VE685_11050 [Thermoanaerobaculia bacterium]|nr:hypothetical protein [Thermoanaerobaculia bacterium]